MKKTAFVSGVARSGTSALVAVLNFNPSFLIGMERFYYLIRDRRLLPGHFTRDRFLNVKDGDTHGKSFGIDMDQRLAAFQEATFVGDKFPLLYKHFDYIFEKFPDAHHIYIVRNPLSVIESYDARFQDKDDNWGNTWEAGLRDWNESVRRAASLSSEMLENFTFLAYEDFFSSIAEINAVFSRFQAPQLPAERLQPFVDKFQALNEKPVARRDDLRASVARHADWEAYRILRDRIDQQKQ